MYLISVPSSKIYIRLQMPGEILSKTTFIGGQLHLTHLDMFAHDRFLKINNSLYIMDRVN